MTTLNGAFLGEKDQAPCILTPFGQILPIIAAHSAMSFDQLLKLALRKRYHLSPKLADIYCYRIRSVFQSLCGKLATQKKKKKKKERMEERKTDRQTDRQEENQFYLSFWRLLLLKHRAAKDQE